MTCCVRRILPAFIAWRSRPRNGSLNLTTGSDHCQHLRRKPFSYDTVAITRKVNLVPPHHPGVVSRVTRHVPIEVPDRNAQLLAQSLDSRMLLSKTSMIHFRGIGL